METSTTTEISMAREEKAFFQRLGARIASLRLGRGLTQTQLGELTGYSQQHVLSFEKGRRRVPVSALPDLAAALGVSIEELLGTAPKPSKRGPSPVLQKQLERLSKLPRSKQRFISEMIETVLQQAS